MLELKDYITAGATLFGIGAAWMAAKVGFQKDIQALREAQNKVPEKIEKSLAPIRDSVKTLQSHRYADPVEVNKKFSAIQDLIHANALAIRELELKNAAGEETRRQQTEMLKETKDTVLRESEKTEEFHREVIKQLSTLSTRLGERTKELHS